jgi:hypothetical protein
MAIDEDPSILQQIARLLDVPTSAFYDPRETRAIGPGAQAAQESSELLEAFVQISDPQVRRECIEFVWAKMPSSSRPARIALTADQA